MNEQLKMLAASLSKFAEENTELARSISTENIKNQVIGKADGYSQAAKWLNAILTAYGVK